MARSRKRIHALDELRGFCLLLMVAFHAFYLIGYTFDVAVCRQLFDFFLPIQPLFAGIFIFLCGLSCNLSRSNLKRGWLLAGAAVLLTAVLWCAVWWRMLPPDSAVWFGILHLLACCVLLYCLFHPVLNRIPPLLGVLLCAALFVLCYHLPFDNGGWFGISGWFVVQLPPSPLDHPLLYPLGLCPISPVGDYVPLLPWLFCFLTGSFTGVWAVRGRFPKWTYRRRVRVFSWLGRHSLIVYLVHQPILYVLCELVLGLFKRVL